MKAEVVFGLEGAAWPALLVDTGGTVMRANSAAARVFNPALSGAAPLLSAIWSPDNGTTAEQFLAQWEKAPAPAAALKLRGGDGVTANYSAAICTFTKDDRKWFVFQLLPVAAPAIMPAAAAGTAPAVEIKPAADAGLILKQKLDCALQLARTVALDFNNALTVILGHTSLLLGRAEAGHPWRHSLMEVEKSAAKAAEIANELNLFSRQERDTSRQPAGNLNVVTNRCVEFFQKNAQGGGIVWKVQLERELFAAKFDEAKVQQALTKILENAVDAVNGQGQISVQSRNMDLTEPTQDRNVHLAAGTYVCIEVGDSGSGIDPDVLPRIFEPFFTTKKAGHRGLGLALVYGIVTNHGGGVAVSSQPGLGASVRVYLPAERQFVRESSTADEDLHGTGTILMVDDEELVLTMGETILTEYGYKVLTANSGQKALTMLSRDDTHIDLVITDLVMPIMSGRELIERIRETNPAMPVLCASGYGLTPDKRVGLAYLRKPFTSQELLMQVRRLLPVEHNS